MKTTGMLSSARLGGLQRAEVAAQPGEQGEREQRTEQRARQARVTLKRANDLADVGV
jgi:hypothetical protein